MNQQLRILEGATFCICDELGDLHGKGEGLFAEDTRFLSGFKLTINGQRQQLSVEPRVTLLDAIRTRLEITGQKRVCDRGA